MKIEVKNYRSCRGDEGDAFSCNLWLDGKKAAEVDYDGRGGPYFFRWLDDVARKRWEEHVASLPEYEYAGGRHKHNEDTALGDMIDQLEAERRVKRWCRTQTVFRVPGDKEGVWRVIKAKYSPQLRAQIIARHPDAEIANERLVG